MRPSVRLAEPAPPFCFPWLDDVCTLAVSDEQEMKKREKANFRIVNLLKPGTKVRAIYADDDNDPSWYDAVINSVEVRGWVGG